eukprot:g19749.t1
MWRSFPWRVRLYDAPSAVLPEQKKPRAQLLETCSVALENEEVYRLQVERLVARAEVLPKHSPDMTAETAAETEEVTAETDEGEATEVTEMDTDDEALPSLGSWGHPELCRRPCVFWVKQQSCAAGANCNFCHLEHQKLVCLDKKQRIIMAEP